MPDIFVQRLERESLTEPVADFEPFLVPFTGLAESVREIAEPVIRDEGCELVQFQLLRGNRKTTVRFYIDRVGGSERLGEDEELRVGLSELESVNRRLSDVLDVEDTERGLFRGAYILEVSSPGIDRPLTKRSHFEAAAGKAVHVKTARLVSGAKKHDGELKGLDGTDIVLSDAQAREVRIPVDAIASANTVFQFSQSQKKPKGGTRSKSKAQAAR